MVEVVPLAGYSVVLMLLDFVIRRRESTLEGLPSLNKAEKVFVELVVFSGLEGVVNFLGSRNNFANVSMSSISSEGGLGIVQQFHSLRRLQL